MYDFRVIQNPELRRRKVGAIINELTSADPLDTLLKLSVINSGKESEPDKRWYSPDIMK